MDLEQEVELVLRHLARRSARPVGPVADQSVAGGRWPRPAWPLPCPAGGHHPAASGLQGRRSLLRVFLPGSGRRPAPPGRHPRLRHEPALHLPGAGGLILASNHLCVAWTSPSPGLVPAGGDLLCQARGAGLEVGRVARRMARSSPGGGRPPGHPRVARLPRAPARCWVSSRRVTAAAATTLLRAQPGVAFPALRSGASPSGPWPSPGRRGSDDHNAELQ